LCKGWQEGLVGKPYTSVRAAIFKIPDEVVIILYRKFKLPAFQLFYSSFTDCFIGK
jgi:hypothetical protein